LEQEDSTKKYNKRVTDVEYMGEMKAPRSKRQEKKKAEAGKAISTTKGNGLGKVNIEFTQRHKKASNQEKQQNIFFQSCVEVTEELGTDLKKSEQKEILRYS